ncbi:MAG: FtsK/SpoIIIE domain-containing protein [Anaerolineae bacterium]
MSTVRYIERPPRLQPGLPSGEVGIPDPPEEERNPSRPLVQVFMPLVSIVGYVLMSISGNGRNLLIMIPMAISVVVSMGMALHSHYEGRKRRRARQAAYLEGLIELRKEMATQHGIQRRFYRHNYPDPSQVLRIAYEAHRGELDANQKGRLGTRLWERRPSDPDFGALRLGLGTRPSTVVYALSKPSGPEDPLVRSAMRLAEDSCVLGDVAITIRLCPSASERNEVECAQDALGVVSGSAQDAYAFMGALLVHYSAFHAPTDAGLYILGLHSARSAWRWLSQLPHCGDEGSRDALCFEDQSDRDGDRDQSKAFRFLRRLRAVLEERQMRLREEDQDADVTRPFLLVVVDMLATVPPESALAELESDPGISLLMAEGSRLGAAILFLVPELGLVPGGCQAVIELTSMPKGEGQTGEEIGFRFAEVGVNTARHAGRADVIRSTQALEQFARYLEPLRVRESYGADLPRSVLMLDMLQVTTAQELRQRILANWQSCQRPDQADWLQSALGMLSGGDIRRLKFSADADGVHGLIAGSTGSGKSELLMTMILSLAYNYDPSIVNFVLVDFKGGAAFEPFRKLPHCVDIVTNLRGNAVERMFAAIMAEIHRREAINVATGSKHIVHYRKNGLHEPPYGHPVTVKGQALKTAPYPHLFVFIDEFAEMIAENPEYKAQLNSITRLGRALGITLILAAQRPTGVTDQMRANIKFRIALRVETREESSEVLRRPDAAYLPTGIPGRGYLQVGNENVELIQVAWTGSEFHGGVEEKTPDVIWHDRSRKGSASSADELPKVFEVMVDTMANLAREHSLPQRKPWPNFLPESMSLQTPVDAGYLNPEGINAILDVADRAGEMEQSVVLNGAVPRWLRGDGGWRGVDWETQAMRAVEGLIDNPHHAEQMPLVVDLRRGHAVVFGASGWGKTTFLRTMITTLAATHSPQELHVYVLDFGGRQLGVFRDLPHVGAIITPDEEERVTRLLRQLDRFLGERKALLSSARADDLYSYNQGQPERALPALLVVIDNFAEFRESFDNLMPMLVSLARESRAYGMHFAVSAELPGALGGKLYSLFTERLALKLSDPTEYTGIVGRGARGIDDIPGRGFVKVGRRALAFQAALPVGAAGESPGPDETRRLGYLVRLLQEAAARLPAERRPLPISTLAERVLLSDLLARATTGASIQVPLGVEDRNLEPWVLNLPVQGPHCLVVGPPNSGKTTTLRSLVLSLAHTYSPQGVTLVLIDYQRRLTRYGGQRTLADLPHVVAAVTDNEELAGLIEALDVECQQVAEDQRAVFVIIDNYDTFAEEARDLREAFPALAALARERGTDGLHFVVAGSPHITRSPEQLRKQLQMPRLGIALQSDDAVLALNGRIPRSLAQAELPLGRGFVVRSGRTVMLQVATPYLDEKRQAESLDRWVQEIRERFPGHEASWQHVQEPAEAEGAEERGGTGEGVEAAAIVPVAREQEKGDEPDLPQQPLALMKSVPDDVDIGALKALLKAEGMDNDLMAIMSPVDLVNVARELKTLNLEPNDE